jgi:tetratricopeptide (TPR) repeat protein
MRSKGKAWLSLALVALAAAGCGKSKTEPAAAASEEPVPAVERYSQEAIMMSETGNVDGAVALLEKGLGEVEAPDQGRLFMLELSLLLNQGRVEDVQARYLKAVAAPAENPLAAQTLGMIEEYLSQQPQGHSNVLAWCDRLEQAGLPEAMRVPVLQNRLSALLALGDYDQALALAETRGWALSDDLASGMVSRIIQTALADGRHETVLSAISLLEAKGAGRAGMAALAASGRIELAVAKGDFDGARDLLFERAAAFDDGAAAGLLDKIARSALAAGKPDASDALAEKALAVFTDKPASLSRAARWWIVRARDAGDLGMGVDRLEKLDSLKMPDRQLIDGVSTLSQMVLQPSVPNAAAARLMAFAGRVKARASDEGDLALLAGVQLDAGFRLEDYAGLVKVLEAGVPGHEKDWHDTMINKVKAHLDLKEGRTDDAVAKFRAFMASIEAQEDQNHRDPITDERVTKEMILGYNHRRIGDIYAQAGRTEESAKAYAQAKALYEKALKGFAESDPEYKTVNTILSELGKRTGG